MLPILGILHSGVSWARASEAQFIGGEAGNPCQKRGKAPCIGLICEFVYFKVFRENIKILDILRSVNYL